MLEDDIVVNIMSLLFLIVQKMLPKLFFVEHCLY